MTAHPSQASGAATPDVAEAVPERIQAPSPKDLSTLYATHVQLADSIDELRCALETAEDLTSETTRAALLPSLTAALRQLNQVNRGVRVFLEASTRKDVREGVRSDARDQANVRRDRRAGWEYEITPAGRRAVQAAVEGTEPIVEEEPAKLTVSSAPSPAVPPLCGATTPTAGQIVTCLEPAGHLPPHRARTTRFEITWQDGMPKRLQTHALAGAQ